LGSFEVKITFILPTISMNGGTKVVAIYAKELMRLGHSVCVIAQPPDVAPLRLKLKSLVNGHGWPVNLGRLPSHLDGSGVDCRILERPRAVTDKDVKNGDVVIATWWVTAEWVSSLSPSKGAKVYFIQHHEVFPYLPIDRCRATYRLPMHKVVVASWLKDVMLSEYDDKIVDLVPNSVDKTQFYSVARGKQSVPTVGLLYASTAFKGLDLSLAALRKVRERFPDLRILCFGSEQPRDELALVEGTEFFFLPPQDQIRSLYAACDVWVTASRSEGFNLPAMEAMACRTPIVATRTGWPEEVIKSGWNGMLVDIEDLRGLTQSIEWILSQSDQNWRSLSSNAYATVAVSSWENSAGLFEEALKHASRRAARGEIAGISSCPVS
jgi:glycosyltransferase involved in cell wall biosynthesis